MWYEAVITVSLKSWRACVGGRCKVRHACVCRQVGYASHRITSSSSSSPSCITLSAHHTSVRNLLTNKHAAPLHTQAHTAAHAPLKSWSASASAALSCACVSADSPDSPDSAHCTACSMVEPCTCDIHLLGYTLISHTGQIELFVGGALYTLSSHVTSIQWLSWTVQCCVCETMIAMCGHEGL